jgi:hypothetical protein
MTTIETQRAHTFRVSVRELKEECYRAMRAEGYYWGECQSAGRIMATNEILWGTGITGVLTDLTRRWGLQRKPRIKVRKGFVRLIDPRKTSVALVGAQATALTLGRNSDPTVVRGAIDLRGVAAAVWDVALPATRVLWGRRNAHDANELEAYSIDSGGDLFYHSSLQATTLGISLRKNSWFMSLDVPSGGQLVLSHQQRVEQIQKALKHGIDVNPQAWSALLVSSRKFLVPE